MAPAKIVAAFVFAFGLLPLAAAESTPTIFVLGDSTARNTAKGKSGEPCAGWGTPLADYFDSAKVAVANVAHAGQSSRTYFNLPGDWPSVAPKIQPGDYVLIVFGINDGGPPRTVKDRGSILPSGHSADAAYFHRSARASASECRVLFGTLRYGQRINEGVFNQGRRLLGPGRLFKFQVQGDCTIDHNPGDTWLGVPFSDADAVAMAEACGFEPRHRHGAGQQYFWLWYFKRPA